MSSAEERGLRGVHRSHARTQSRAQACRALELCRGYECQCHKHRDRNEA